jgi:superoxide dismutase, Cu-Zn family
MNEKLTSAILLLTSLLACSSHSNPPPAQVGTEAPPADPSVSAPGHSHPDAAYVPVPAASSQVHSEGSAVIDTTVSSTATGQTASGTPAPLEARIEARSGSSMSGSVTLTSVSEGVRVQVRVAGVSPGAHGIHFHQQGDCSAQDASSAGDHFNPTHQPHALPTSSKRHIGDLGNITARADGEGTLDITVPGATLAPNAPNTLRGRALIVHAKPDDGGQPSGNAGPRIGCAVIAR